MQIKHVKYKEKERILAGALTRAKPLTDKEEFSGQSPSPFVGRFGYPTVTVGILAPPHHNNTWEYDAPRYWAQEEMEAARIVGYRSGMINSTFSNNIHKIEALTELAQEVAMAKKPADIDVSLKKKPSLSIKTSQWTAPMGPSSQLKNISITSNTKIPAKIQRFYDDKDVKAAEALSVLYSKGVDENALNRMLSVGVFGKNRKLVPTRWSITATDDTIANSMLEKVREFPNYDYIAHFGGYLGNYYLILFMPEHWSYELFELYVKPGVLEYSTDHERFGGRKRYADNTVGGYYTVRLSVAEHLQQKKRQATALVFRFITEEYVLPLGVWVTREAARKSLSNKPIRFGNKELMLIYARQLAKKKFGVDLDKLLQKSVLLKEQQKTLTQF